MQVPNTSWVLVAANPTLLEMQNVDSVRIAYAYAATLPQSEFDDPTFIGLETDDHFILGPGHPPYRHSGSALGTNVYARALGPRAANLAVRSIP